MNLTASLEKRWFIVRTSFWFFPISMVIASTLVAIMLIYIDKTLSGSLPKLLTLIYGLESSVLLSLVTTIAGSMITVTSIAFSITIVVLTLASSQFGPRIIRNFMDDKATQIVLGTFISNFTYCLTLVYAMSFRSEQSEVYGLATVWCLIATFFSVLVLIFFIHHVAKSIQADNVVNNVYCDLRSSFASIVDENESSSQCNQFQAERHHSVSIKATENGYLQIVDIEALVKTATDHDILIDVLIKPGEVVVKGMDIASINYHSKPPEDLTCERIGRHLLIGSQRTPMQDPEYAVHQLVEIASRSLSPGINDPYTAITCIDKLSTALCELARNTIQKGTYCDENGVLRLTRKTNDFYGLGRSAFDQIRQYAHSSVAVTIRILENLHRIQQVSSKPEVTKLVQHQIAQIEETVRKQNWSEEDLADVKRHLG